MNTSQNEPSTQPGPIHPRFMNESEPVQAADQFRYYKALTNQGEKQSITVRFVDDTKEGKCWFEEKLSNGQWAAIPSTRYACEGNSRHALSQEIERRRQQRLMIFRNIGQEETFPIE